MNWMIVLQFYPGNKENILKHFRIINSDYTHTEMLNTGHRGKKEYHAK